MLFAAKPAHIREFLKIPASAFTPPMPNPIEPVVGDGSIILLDGIRHKHERARFLPALHHERIRRYTGLMAEARWTRSRSGSPARPLTRATRRSRSRCRSSFKRCSASTTGTCRDHYVTVVKAMMRDYVAPFMFFPALRRAPFGLGPWQRFSARRVELDALLSEQISHRRHNGADGYDDVLSVLMSDDDGAKRSDDEVRQQLRTLLVSGHETSATTLAWALYHVHADEKVRQKLLDELADNPGRQSSCRSCPTSAAVIAETLRMHPTVSIVVRQLKRAVTTWQTERAPGDVIGVALPALHADPQVWPDPSGSTPSAS